LKKYLLLALCAVTVQAGTITLTNNTPGLFDGSSGTRDVTVTGLEPGFGLGTITSVLVSIDFAKADGEAFDPPFPGGTPFFNEISFTLTSPATTQVALIADGSWAAGTGQFDGVITFDEAADSVVNFGAAPVAGTFRTTGPGSLNDFIAQAALGVWTLGIGDSAGGDALRFRSFTLTLNTDSGGSAVPEPSSMALIGLGLLGLGVRNLRKKKSA